MRKSSKILKQNLLEIAEPQGGYFNSMQAIKAGYSNPTHVYHLKTGDWIRLDRGIYRLADYPAIYVREDLIVLSLWSANRQGIVQGTFSYQTALDILGGTDVMPPKVHMTVPKAFRRNAQIPSMLELHYENLDEKDVQLTDGIRITTAKKTLEDLYLSEAVDRKTWTDACRFLLGPTSPKQELWIKSLTQKKSNRSHDSFVHYSEA